MTWSQAEGPGDRVDGGGGGPNSSSRGASPWGVPKAVDGAVLARGRGRRRWGGRDGGRARGRRWRGRRITCPEGGDDDEGLRIRADVEGAVGSEGPSQGSQSRNALSTNLRKARPPGVVSNDSPGYGYLHGRRTTLLPRSQSPSRGTRRSQACRLGRWRVPASRSRARSLPTSCRQPCELRPCPCSQRGNGRGAKGTR